MTLSIDLDKQLKLRNMTIDELCDKALFTPTEIAILKKITLRDSRLKILEKVCKALDCDVQDVLIYENKEEEK
ncbi:MAG: helix-turn-helix transcriptional regulator [Saprospiraceae bacterium]|nr:helix-turn-helix transcriptional regulator [Saprospiraceae bacterium]